MQYEIIENKLVFAWCPRLVIGEAYTLHFAWLCFVRRIKFQRWDGDVWFEYHKLIPESEYNGD